MSNFRLEHRADMVLPTYILNQTALNPLSTEDGWFFQGFIAGPGGGPAVFRWKNGMTAAEEVGRMPNLARGDIAPSWDGNVYALNHSGESRHNRVILHQVVGATSPFLRKSATQTPQHCLSAVAELERRIASLEVRLHELVELLRQAR